jgi:SAM-dependent methyltransferase
MLMYTNQYYMMYYQRITKALFYILGSYELLGNTKDMNVLDCGCGNGLILRELPEEGRGVDASGEETQCPESLVGSDPLWSAKSTGAHERTQRLQAEGQQQMRKQPPLLPPANTPSSRPYMSHRGGSKVSQGALWVPTHPPID